MYWSGETGGGAEGLKLCFWARGVGRECALRTSDGKKPSTHACINNDRLTLDR